jgi:hypothetical protein
MLAVAGAALFALVVLIISYLPAMLTVAGARTLGEVRNFRRRSPPVVLVLVLLVLVLVLARRSLEA